MDSAGINDLSKKLLEKEKEFSEVRNLIEHWFVLWRWFFSFLLEIFLFILQIINESEKETLEYWKSRSKKLEAIIQDILLMNSQTKNNDVPPPIIVVNEKQKEIGNEVRTSKKDNSEVTVKQKDSSSEKSPRTERRSTKMQLPILDTEGIMKIKE